MDFSRLLKQFLAQFHPANLVANFIVSEILTGATRLAAYAFQYVPSDERYFWGSMSVAFFAVVIVARFLTKGSAESPILRPSIDAVIHSQRDSNAPMPGANVFIIASVRNSGLPTALEGWSLVAVPANGERLEGLLHVIPQTLTLEGIPGQGSMPLKSSDALYNKAVERPLERGGWFAVSYGSYFRMLMQQSSACQGLNSFYPSTMSLE